MIDLKRTKESVLIDFVIVFEDDLDVVNLLLPAIQEGVDLPGDVGDGLLVVVGDAMVPCPVLLVGVCLLGPIKSQRQLTLTTWSRKYQGLLSYQQSYTNDR